MFIRISVTRRQLINELPCELTELIMNDQIQSAFPVLNHEQMLAVAEIGELASFERDEILIKQGTRDFPFYVIQTGEVRIVEKVAGGERPITTHGRHQFTGDVDMLTGRSSGWARTQSSNSCFIDRKRNRMVVVC